MAELNTSVLYYGDNLDVLRKHIPDESVDLIYLDPPFNSNRSYNVLFRESTGAASEAQIEAFEDTWKWGPIAALAYEEVVTGPHQQVARMLKAMVEGLGRNDVTAYLSMMAPRLVELHRVLKATGSMYLHCDPTASHYLKALLDAIFGPSNFRNEIVWKRTTIHRDAKRFGRVADYLLYYSKTDSFTWQTQFSGHQEDYVSSHYTYADTDGRRYRLDNATAAGQGPPRYYDGKLLEPPPGTHWRWSQENIDKLIREGRIAFTRTGRPSYKRYLDEMAGTPVPSIWDDIPPVNSQAKERLGYPTQKPLALLERIISASSNPGDIVLDPFCGCGTAVHAAHKLGRRWIGIDVTYLAINLIERRMRDAFPGITIEVEGDPKDLASAQDLARRDKWQFQWWALAKLNAQPVAGKKKGADRGIDGVIPYFAGPKEDYRRAIVSVKGGEHVTVSMVRDLVGVLEREKEPLGVLLTLEPPTQPMTTEAAAAGFYHSEFWQKDYPRVQIITVEDMLNGKRPELPSTRSPFAQAPLEKEEAKQGGLM
ncbi:MAG: DNA methyltransferase [Chloroflexota bacterium]